MRRLMDRLLAAFRPATPDPVKSETTKRLREQQVRLARIDSVIAAQGHQPIHRRRHDDA